jgi:hypothetical protein
VDKKRIKARRTALLAVIAERMCCRFLQSKCVHQIPAGPVTSSAFNHCANFDETDR